VTDRTDKSSAGINQPESGAALISMGLRRPSQRRARRKAPAFLEPSLGTWVLGYILCFPGWLLPTALAASPIHRIALQVGGSVCSVQQTVLSNALLALPGVIAVDWSLLPDHALVDLDIDSITEQDLVAAAARTAGPSCDVRPMTSCISPMPATSTVMRPIESARPLQ